MKNLIFIALMAFTFAQAEEVDSKLQIPLPDNVKGELILSYPKVSDKDFTTDDALKICKDYQKLYYKKYFYVFCKMKFDEVNEKEFALKEHESWTLMGISVTEERDHWGYYRRTESPIFKKEKFQKWELDNIVKRKILSLAIWGVGNFETEKLKVVYPSVADAPALVTLSFDSKAEAWISCLEILAEKKREEMESLRFERARCELETVADTGRYKIKIVSQNPFL